VSVREDEPSYFTARILAGAKGIGDQIYQLQVLYNLGRSCGWRYLHDATPTAWVNRDRSDVSTRFDYQTLLGLALEETPLSAFARPSFVELDARHVLKRLVTGSTSRANVRFVRLRFHPWFYEDYEKASELVLPLRYRLDICRKFALARREDPIALPFREGAVPVVVFLRLMELVFYEDDGELVVPCFPGNEVVKGYVNPPARVLELVKTLVEALRPRPVDVWVYSDGLPERSWLVQRIFARRRDRGRAEAEADRALAFQKDRLAALARIDAPVHFKTEGSIELIREVVQAFSLAPFVSNSRAHELGRHTLRTGFPDLGQRDPGLFPVITPGWSPERLADAVRAYASEPGRFAAWGVHD